MSTTISVERRQVLHKLIKEQHLETLSDEIQRDKSKITENFNVDELYALDNNGKTLLMTATEEGNIQMIRLLHKQFNASLNYLDKNQQSCVFYCVEMKNYHKSETILEYLLSNQANANIVNSCGYSPFYIALKNNNLPAAYLLYAEGNANINQIIDKDNNTAIHEAVKSGNIASVVFLVTQCGADLLKTNTRGEIPFFLALQYPRMINQVLKSLSPSGKEPKRTLINSSSANKRASFDAVEYVNTLVRFKNPEKQNILHKCASMGYIHSLGELLTHLSEQNISEMTCERDQNGNTPLHLSVINNYPEICFSLNQLKPSDCLIQNNDGDTPMHIALKSSAYKCARILYNNSKACTKVNNKDETIQFLLQQFKHELKQEDDISKTLLQIDLTNPENYRFHKLITDHTFVSKMKDFLSLNNNQDMMLFYETVQEFKMINSHSERYHQAEQIVEHFISEDSQHKLKFLKNAFGPFRVKFNECSADHCPKDLFLNLETLAIRSLKVDSFPKFIHSKLFTKYLERKKQTDPTFLVRFIKSELTSDKSSDDTSDQGGSTRGTHHSTTTGGSTNNTGSTSSDKDRSSDSDEIIELEDDCDVKEHVKFCPKCGTELINLENYVYTDKEFKKIIENLKDMNQWRVIHDSDTGRTYSSPPELHNHLSNSRRHTQIKYVGEMECSSHSLFNMWIDPDYIQSREERLESCKQIDFIKSGNYATVIHHEILKMKFPQKNREFVHAFCCKFDEDEQRYLCVSRSVNHPKAPECSKFVRGEVKTAFMVERVSDIKCRYYYAVTADFGGWLSADFYANMVKGQSEKIHHGLIKLVKQREQLGKKRPEKGGLVQSLDYYLSKKD
ncbi:RGS domain-containing protein [Naegleria gruberi]|uniref:RGS domain-containing protein n=1 Tax=Naegleria gruberi TaxID=5762 RepID=D2V6Z4_NAEGR|nr:RGS domain-containing protein [Naegleria gruberi]EFC47284.1 RGS domain-containing protein [Naegleria gruberi]|eukprot:XP_002680028.1 RGS domain-containing protein [Naegleria gruberi strain NEG-M]